ncbi:MAG: holo-ACP synthase [Armatimonadota bacterium]|nr:holo-ACP synthase [Armatimonadota bacterium]MDR7533573.1 holo-ACP synthase [Armatimonadota bacterium]MDR7537373.1 holo-ACP synthase [Armatimonadota bacterium]
MIVGVGVDIVEVARIQRAIARWGDGFVRRIYTAREVERAAGAAVLGPRLAARFAAKEAVMKALGCGWRELAWREIEITNDPQGRPMVHLHGAARRIAAARGIAEVYVALSHTHDHAIANAVAVGPS